MATNRKPTPLQAHIASTYFGLRWGLVALAGFLPVVLPLGALLAGIRYQHSLSAYYHALGPNGESARDVFVGLLLVVGALLYLYKGYSRWENWLLNAAGLLVAGVALFPMRWPEVGRRASAGVAQAAVESFSPHGTFAVCFFLCIATVCIFCSKKTLPLISDRAKRARYRNTYHVLGGIMLAAPLTAYIMSFTIDGDYAIILVESAGVLAFGVYWFVKTRELALSNAERDALTGKLELPIESASGDTPDQGGLAPIVVERAGWHDAPGSPDVMP